MGHSIFKADYPLMITWFNQKGYSGSLNEMIISYFRSKLGGTTLGYPNDLVATYLRSLGYSGDIGTMLDIFFKNTIGVTNPIEAQRLFFSSISNDFSGGNDSFTKLLLHMNGTNGSSIFTDSSSLATSITRNGSAIISTGQSKFGGASGLFTPATSDYLSFTDTSNYQVGAGDFTIDFWFNTTSLALGTQTIISDLNAVGSNTSIQVDFDHVNSPDSLRCTLSFTDLTSLEIDYGTTLSTGTWYHCAVVRNGANVNLYVNGVSGGGTGNAASKTVKANQNGGSWSIGRAGSYTGNLFFSGNIDEFRFSKGIARWTSNFSVPILEYS